MNRLRILALAVAIASTTLSAQTGAHAPGPRQPWPRSTRSTRTSKRCTSTSISIPSSHSRRRRRRPNWPARLKALGFDVATGVGRTGIVAVLKNGAGPTVDAAHRARRAAGRRKDRTPVRQHRGGEERQRPIDAGDARVRPRPSHVGVGRHGASDGRAPRPLARHADAWSASRRKRASAAPPRC